MQTASVLVIGLVGIGDLLLFMPTLESLSRRLKHARIDMLAPHEGASDLLQMAGLNGIRVVPMRIRNGERLPIRALKISHAAVHLMARHYDISMWPFAVTTTNKELYSWLIGARIRLLHENHHATAHPLKRLNRLVSVKPKTHKIELNLALLEPLKIEPCVDPYPRLAVSSGAAQDARAFVRRFVKGEKITVAIHPGGNLEFSPSRCWGVANFAELIDLLIITYDAHIFLLSGYHEISLVNRIRTKVKNRGQVTPVWGMSLAETAAIIQQTDIFVGNNSSLMHISAAVGTQTLGIFGSTDPTLTGPRGGNTWVVRLDMACSPCFEKPRSQRSMKCIHCTPLACLRLLEPCSVLKVIEDILQNGSQCGVRNDGRYPNIVNLQWSTTDERSTWMPIDGWIIEELLGRT